MSWRMKTKGVYSSLLRTVKSDGKTSACKFRKFPYSAISSLVNLYKKKNAPFVVNQYQQQDH